MKKSKFSEAQIAFVLKQAEDGAVIGEVFRKAGISEATFYTWRKKYAGLMPSEMKRLRQLEDENGKLKRIVADLSLDRAMLQDVIRRRGGLTPAEAPLIDAEKLFRQPRPPLTPPFRRVISGSFFDIVLFFAFPHLII